MIKKSRFYFEEDEATVDDKEMEATEGDTDEGSPEEESDEDDFESMSFDASKDEYDMDEDIAYGDENVDKEDLKTGTPTTMAVDVDITTMGSDNSQVQNQYSPKEIERLNALLASENSAIGEYFQASKETNVDILRRLYSDIGEEERFHSEQLLFAKSQLTGEPYVPRDPDVKKEYEELLALGMDEESAMTAAVDKVGISRSINANNEEIEQQMEAAIEDMDFIQRSMYQEYVLMNIMNTPSYNREKMMKTYTEAYINEAIYKTDFIMEEVVNNTENPPQKTGILKMIIRIITGIGGAIRKILDNMKAWGTSLKSNIERKREWLKNHSLADIFKSGIHMYFFDDKTFDFDFDSPIKYLHRIFDCMNVIVSELDISVNKPNISFDSDKSGTYVTNAEQLDGKVKELGNVRLTKTKIIFNNDKIKETFANKVFLVDDQSKYNRGLNGSVHSNFSRLLNDFGSLSGYIGQVSKKVNEMQQQQGSLYFENRQKYERYVGYLKTLTDCCQRFMTSMTSDINEMMKATKYFDATVKSKVDQKTTSKYISREINRIKAVLQDLKDKPGSEQVSLLTKYISDLEKLKSMIGKKPVGVEQTDTDTEEVKEESMRYVSGHSRFYTEGGAATDVSNSMIYDEYEAHLGTAQGTASVSGGTISRNPHPMSTETPQEDNTTDTPQDQGNTAVNISNNITDTIQSLIDLAKSLLDIAKTNTPDKMKSAIDFSINFVQGLANEAAEKIGPKISAAVENIKSGKFKADATNFAKNQVNKSVRELNNYLTKINSDIYECSVKIKNGKSNEANESLNRLKNTLIPELRSMCKTYIKKSSGVTNEYAVFTENAWDAIKGTAAKWNFRTHDLSPQDILKKLDEKERQVDEFLKGNTNVEVEKPTEENEQSDQSTDNGDNTESTEGSDSSGQPQPETPNQKMTREDTIKKLENLEQQFRSASKSYRPSQHSKEEQQQLKRLLSQQASYRDTIEKIEKQFGSNPMNKQIWGRYIAAVSNYENAIKKICEIFGVSFQEFMDLMNGIIQSSIFTEASTVLYLLQEMNEGMSEEEIKKALIDSGQSEKKAIANVSDAMNGNITPESMKPFGITNIINRISSAISNVLQNIGNTVSEHKDAKYLEKSYGGFINEHQVKLKNFRGELGRIPTKVSRKQDGGVITEKLNSLKNDVDIAKGMFDRMYNHFREDAGLPTKPIGESYNVFQESIFKKVDPTVSSIADKFVEVENGYNQILEEINQRIDKLNPLAAEKRKKDEQAAKRQAFHDDTGDKFSTQAAAEREAVNGTTGSEDAMKAAKEPTVTGDEKFGVFERGKMKKSPDGCKKLYAVNRASLSKLINQSQSVDRGSKEYRRLQKLIKKVQSEQQDLSERYQRLTGRTIEESFIPTYFDDSVIQEYVNAIESEIVDDPIFGYFS